MPNYQSTSTKSLTAAKNVPCVPCNRIFKNNAGLSNHNRKVHNAPLKGTYVAQDDKYRERKEVLLSKGDGALPQEISNASKHILKIIDTPEGRKTNVTIAYSPRALQLQVHKAIARYKVIVAHRRFGKTTLAINELVKAALEKPGRYWYVAPTYRQAKTIAYALLQRYLPMEFIVKKNEQELTFQLSTGSEIALKGAENRDSLRGVGLNGLVLDEYGMMEREVWEAILEPTLQDDPVNPGWAIFIGTPNGRNHFYELFAKADGEKWKAFHFSGEETGILSKDYLADRRDKLPQDTYRQEYLAEFLEGEGSVFRGLKNVIRPKHQCYFQPQFGASYQMGVDLAKMHDWTVLTVVDGQSRVVYWERFSKIDWEYQKLKIMAVAERYNHARVVIDATGVGDPIAQDLISAGLAIMPFKISSAKVKKELIDNLKLRIEQQQVTIPEEKQLVAELEAYQFILTPSGTIKYAAPGGFHDDCVISLALAIWQLSPASYQRAVHNNFGIYDDRF